MAVGKDDSNLPSTRSGLQNLYTEATRIGKLVVISRISNEKVLPWMVSPVGAIRCYDTVSLSQKLSLHRHALQSIHIHVLMWDRPVVKASGGRPPRAVPSGGQKIQSMSPNDGAVMVKHGDGEGSFKFIDFPVSRRSQ